MSNASTLRSSLAIGVAVVLTAGGAYGQTAPPNLLSPAPIVVAPPPSVPPPAVVTPAPVAPAPVAGAQVIPGAVAPLPIPTDTKAAEVKPKIKRIAPPTPPRETALSTDPSPTFQPDTFFATAKASERYGAIADAGGWPTIPAKIAPGAKGKPVATLRLRLSIEGDLHGAGGEVDTFSTTWTPDLTDAVKRFQDRHGLRQTGIVAGATLKALNVSAQVRFQELASSAQRIAGRPFGFGERYVVVNIPSASVEAVENGRVVHRYVSIVGGVDHPSPEVDAKVQAINLNPTWTVPTSIIKNEIIPKMQKDPGYLSRAKIRILDGQGNAVNPRSVDWTSQRAVNYTLRQDSGAGNSLGSIRINMPNKLAVYMHDTPSRHLFGADYRFLSHGCVRVEGVYDLAAWLLEGTGGAATGSWDRPALLAKQSDGERTDIKLSRAVPVAWVYMTGWANQDGVVQFRDDVYGLDTIGLAQASTSALTAAR